MTVGGTTYNDCLMIAEWDPLEPGILEHDYHAPGVGSIREQAVRGESDYVDLVDIITQ